MLYELAVVIEPARAGRDREVLGQVVAELAEHRNLLELRVVTPEEPAFGRFEKVAKVGVLETVKVVERRGVLVVADEAVELGMPLLFAVEGADQPAPTALRIGGRLQPGLERRDVGLLVVGREAARITAEVVDHVRCVIELEVELVICGIRLVVKVPVEVRGREDEIAEPQRRVEREPDLVPLVVEALVLEPNLIQIADAEVDVAVSAGLQVLDQSGESHVNVVGRVPAQRRARALGVRLIDVFGDPVGVVERAFPGERLTTRAFAQDVVDEPGVLRGEPHEAQRKAVRD